MSKCVTIIDIENINLAFYKSKQNDPFGFGSFKEVAEITGWSVSTVRKYVNKYYIPPLKIQKEIEIQKEKNNIPGVYLITMDTNKDYYIKVGQSLCVGERLKKYKTENPLAKCIDILPCRKDCLNDTEHFFHQQLKQLGEQVDRTEWYKVSKEIYNKIKEYKFNKKIWIEEGTF